MHITRQAVGHDQITGRCGLLAVVGGSFYISSILLLFFPPSSFFPAGAGRLRYSPTFILHRVGKECSGFPCPGLMTQVYDLTTTLLTTRLHENEKHAYIRTYCWVGLAREGGQEGELYMVQAPHVRKVFVLWRLVWLILSPLAGSVLRVGCGLDCGQAECMEWVCRLVVVIGLAVVGRLWFLVCTVPTLPTCGISVGEDSCQ
jgi:hypothetical protein